MAKSNYDFVKAWRARPENKEKINAQVRRWRERHPEIRREISARHRAANLERIRAEDAERQREYRQTERYRAAQARRHRAFRDRQKAERVAIAGREPSEACELCGGNVGGIVFDHCHASGAFRGWICDRCNKVLGLVKDDRELLKAMCSYLEKADGKPDDHGCQFSESADG